MFGSYDKNAEVKKFMTDFSDDVATKDKVTSEKMCPDTVKDDLLKFVFDAEEAKIKIMSNKTIKISIGVGKGIILENSESDGNLKIKNSFDIFVFP